MKNVQSRWRALSVLLSLVLAPTAAHAFEAIDTLPWPARGGFPAYPAEDDRPTDYWFNAGMRWDDNALRTGTGERSDTIMRFGAGVRHETRVIGRQRVRLEARGDYYKYNEFTGLDHFAYSVLGNWLWEIGNNLSGTVVFGRDRRQVDMAETRAERLDTATLTRVGGTAAYLISPSFRVRGGLAGTRADQTTTAETETREISVSAAAEYVSPLANTVGVEYRSTAGDAPSLEFVDPLGAFVSNDFRETELALVATYALGERLRTGLRVGRTKRAYDELPARDFDGNTWRATLDWLPGAKTILGFEAYREPRSVIDVSASHILVSGVAFGPRWAATNKLVLSARLARERRVSDGDPALTAGATVRDELIHLLRFAVGWEPQRRWQIGVAVDRGERDSNLTGGDYDFIAVMGNVAYVW